MNKNIKLKNCLNCRKKIQPRAYVKYDVLKYCSTNCSYEFRDKIRAKYLKYKKKNCEICGCEKTKSEYWGNRKLVVHHKDNNPANNRKSNLQTLCRNCHIKVHKDFFINRISIPVLKLEKAS